jgi:hypothetical protein
MNVTRREGGDARKKSGGAMMNLAALFHLQTMAAIHMSLTNNRYPPCVFSQVKSSGRIVDDAQQGGCDGS